LQATNTQEKNLPLCHFHITYLPVGALKLNVGLAMLIYAVTHVVLVHILISPVTGLEWPRGFQEVKVPRFHDNGTSWW